MLFKKTWRVCFYGLIALLLTLSGCPIYSPSGNQTDADGNPLNYDIQLEVNLLSDVTSVNSSIACFANASDLDSYDLLAV